MSAGSLWLCPVELLLPTTEAIEFVKPGRQLAENPYADQSRLSYKNTTVPLPSGQWPDVFSPMGWGWGRRSVRALAALLTHGQTGDFARLIRLLSQDEMGSNDE